MYIDTSANAYAAKCFELACNIIGFLDNNVLRQDVCIRYNRKAGAYVSIDPDNTDRVIMHTIEFPQTDNRGELSYFLQLELSNKSFFPTEN